MPLDISGSLLTIFLVEKNLITTITILIFFFGGISPPLSKGDDNNVNCKEYTKDGKLVADCSSQSDAITVPTNLNPNIQGLNLSNNRITNLGPDSFAKYRESLVWLDISHGKASLPNSAADSFVPLKNLQYMDISYTCFANKSVFQYPIFPSSLKIFKMAGCDIYENNFTNLISLEEFHGELNNFMHFPNFNTNAPLKYVNIRASKLFSLTIPEIAPFCHLEELVIKLSDGDGIQQPQFYCQCKSLDKWLTYTSVQYPPLSCSKPSPVPNCDTTVENTALDLRQKCTGPIAKWPWWLIPLLLLVILLLLLMAFMLKTRKAKLQEEEIVEEELETEQQYVEITTVSPKPIPKKVTKTTSLPTTTHPDTTTHPPIINQPVPATPTGVIPSTTIPTRSPFIYCEDLNPAFVNCPPNDF